MDTGHVVAAVSAGAIAATPGAEDVGAWVVRTAVLLLAGFLVKFGERWLDQRFPRPPSPPSP